MKRLPTTNEQKAIRDYFRWMETLSSDERRAEIVELLEAEDRRYRPILKKPKKAELR